MGAKKKQSRCTGLYWFMQHLKPSLLREGRTNMGIDEILPIARPLWQRMTKAEREPFERQAKDEKKRQRGQRPDDERMDNTGQIIADRVDREKEFQKKRENDRRKAKAAWPPGREVIRQKFYQIYFEHLCAYEFVDDNHQECIIWIPREVALVEFTLLNGVTKSLHRFIFTCGIPKGFRYTATTHSAERHQIPIEDFEFDDRNHAGLWNEIANFINPNGELEENPPIYVLSHSMQIVVSCMQWLYDQAFNQPDAKRYELPQINRFYVLEDLVQDLYINIGSNITPTSVHDMLTATSFDFEPHTRCFWHEERGDAAHVCAMGNVKRCIFSMLDSLCNVYDFTLTEHHVPDPNTERPTYTTIAPSAMAGTFDPPSPSHYAAYPGGVGRGRGSVVDQDDGPFPSRDIRQFKNQRKNYGDDDDESFTNSDEETLIEYTRRASPPKNAWGAAPTAAAVAPNMENDDDFPSLGATSQKFAARAGPPPPSSVPSWMANPAATGRTQDPVSNQKTGFQAVAAAVKPPSPGRGRGFNKQDSPVGAVGGGWSPTGRGRGSPVRASGVGGPVFIPPSPAESAGAQNTASVQQSGPAFVPPTGEEPGRASGSVFSPPDGIEPARRGPSRVTGTAAFRMPPPPQRSFPQSASGSNLPAGDAVATASAAASAMPSPVIAGNVSSVYSPANTSPLPTTQPFGGKGIGRGVGRGRGVLGLQNQAVRPPPGFGVAKQQKQ